MFNQADTYPLGCLFYLGRAWVHDLDVKLAEAGKAGFQGVEIFWEDLVFAAKKIDPNADERNESDMLGAAQYARDLCEEYGLIVMALQPFMNYEGILDEAKHQEHIVKLKLWFKVVKILGVDMIQIPSQVCYLKTVDLELTFGLSDAF